MADDDMTQVGAVGADDGQSPATRSNGAVGDGATDTTIGFSREAAALIAFLASPGGGYVTGTTVVMDGGLDV